MLYTKTCALCDTKIKSSHRLCGIHFTQYRDQINENWFKALCEEQTRMDIIDRRESYSLPYGSSTNIYGIYEAPELLSKKDVGRPSTDWRIVDKVLQIYDFSVQDVKEGKAIRPKSLRAIAKEIGNTIGYVSVRNILREYRREVYYNAKTISVDV